MVGKNFWAKFGTLEFTGTIRSANLTREFEAVDDTVAGNGGVRTQTAGLENWGLELEIRNDFSSGGIDELIYPLVGTTALLEFQPDGPTVGTSNPKYSGQAVFLSFPPVSQSIGDLIVGTATFGPAAPLGRTTS